MKPSGFLFRTFLLGLFTLSLLGGVIVTDYYLRHEITRKAKRFLASNGIELSANSAIEAAQSGELGLLEKLENAGLSLGQSNDSGKTPLLAAVQSRNLQAIQFLIERDPVLESINRLTNPDRDTPLATALRNRDFELAKTLLAKGADINVDKEAGLPFLIDAVVSSDSEMLDFLFENGADLEYKSARPAGALAEAAAKGDLALLKRLLDAGASPNARGVSGKQLLIEAVKEGDRKKFDLLLAAGADVNATTGETTGKEMSALSFAVESGNVEIQEALLKAGASPDVYSVTGEPLLYESVYHNDRDTTSRLLSYGAKADIASDDKVTPLGVATLNENLDMVDLLLANEANPSFHAEGAGTPLQAAVASGNIAIANQLIVAGAKLDTRELLAKAYEKRDDPLMNLLLSAGADPESTFPETGERVFDRAVSDGATGAVRTLLAAGADIGDNLWAALLTGQDDLIRLILAAGADPREPGPDGQDPLSWCLTHKRYRAAGELLAGGANPNARYDSEETWLTKSIREGNADVSLAFLMGGAEVKGIKARDGHSLLGWAVAHEMPEVVKALLEAGADPNVQERAPSTREFQEMFESNTFKYHLRVDRRITPIMMAAAHRNHEIAQILMDGGANGKAYTPKYLMAAIIGSWYKDTKIQQIALLGKVPEVQPRKLIVDLSSQRVTLYEYGKAVFSSHCSTGKSGYRTPTGEYVISDRHRHHNSSIYGSSMPYFQRFSYAAFGIHQGHCPGYAASHGCIRLPWDAARHLFSKLQVGDYAVVQQ
jgi:ankyrin repeat protein